MYRYLLCLATSDLIVSNSVVQKRKILFMIGASVIREDHTQGKIIGEQENKNLTIEFDDGSRIIISADLLVQQDDGTYFVPFDLNSAQELTIPVIEEEITIEKQRLPKRIVRVNKQVETREQKVDTTTNHEIVIVKHVPINQIIEGTPPITRNEKGVLIIPVLEEVLVVEKRLMLMEEVHVSKVNTQKTIAENITLRREHIEVEKTDVQDTKLPEDIDFENT